MLLCENPLPPLEEAIAAAQAVLPRSNYYTEPYSAPLRQFLSGHLGVPEHLSHINAGSELILRQIFDQATQRSTPRVRLHAGDHGPPRRQLTVLHLGQGTFAALNAV